MTGHRIQTVPGRSDAALDMYILPELEKALAAWWQVLGQALQRQGLTDVPDQLIWPEDIVAHWKSPDLLLSQTCGFPLTHALKDQVQYLVTPCYNAPGCDGPTYRSAFVVRADQEADSLKDLRGKRVAINGWDSQSGMNCLRAAIAPLAGGQSYFSEVLVSGGHALSMEMVADGKADLAAIDGVTLAIYQQHRPQLTERLKILSWSEAVPGLPYITSLARPAEQRVRIRTAVCEAFELPEGEQARAALLLTGCEILSEEAYQPLVDMEEQAQALGYPVLA
ncbi:phosphate/phosphite/phosphonate ABC transporter substrate-binding protein [Rhodovibrionaceae bacterium A322]